MRSPNWHESEMMLALDLYLNRDLDWLTKISDSTDEIVGISKLFNCLDFYKEKPANFRSPGSIRMRIANFMALDERYKQNALDNGGPLAKKVWDTYSNKKEELHSKCMTIISQHLLSRPKEVEQYIWLMHLEEEDNVDPNFSRFARGLRRELKYYSRIADQNSEIFHSEDVANWCEKAYDSLAWIDEIEEDIVCQYDWTYKEHAGVNMAPINKKSKSVRNKPHEDDNEEKIGKLVRRTFEDLVDQEKISEQLLGDLLNEKYSQDNFGLKLPFLRLINEKTELRVQILDENGYVRYWTKPVNIHGKNYCINKEWYSNQRERYTRWLSLVDIKPFYMISAKSLQDILVYLKKLDEKKVSFERKEIQEHFKNELAINELLNILINKNVLSGFQGSNKELVIDDYDSFFKMMNNPTNYALE